MSKLVVSITCVTFIIFGVLVDEIGKPAFLQSIASLQERYRFQKLLADYHLPSTAKPSQLQEAIEAELRKQSDELRRQAAIEYGLPPDSPPDVVEDEGFRRYVIAQFGLKGEVPYDMARCVNVLYEISNATPVKFTDRAGGWTWEQFDACRQQYHGSIAAALDLAKGSAYDLILSKLRDRDGTLDQRGTSN